MAQRSAVRRMMPLIVVGGVVIALAAAVWFGQRSLMYPADRSAVPPAGELLPGAVDVTLTTSDDVALGAWYLEAAEPCTAAVLVAQGNGGNRGCRRCPGPPARPRCTAQRPPGTTHPARRRRRWSG